VYKFPRCGRWWGSINGRRDPLGRGGIYIESSDSILLERGGGAMLDNGTCSVRQRRWLGRGGPRKWVHEELHVASKWML
jgi:hypothetical protein